MAWNSTRRCAHRTALARRGFLARRSFSAHARRRQRRDIGVDDADTALLARVLAGGGEHGGERGDERRLARARRWLRYDAARVELESRRTTTVRPSRDRGEAESRKEAKGDPPSS